MHVSAQEPQAVLQVSDMAVCRQSKHILRRLTALNNRD